MSRLEELSVGDELPTVEKQPTPPQLFRYSAITWNPHRIHYDPEYAREEGHSHVLVQAHLHGAIIQELLMDWLGTDGELTDLSWRNTGPATPENTLYAGAEVTAIDPENRTVAFEVWTETAEIRCAEGTAKIQLNRSPSRG